MAERIVGADGKVLGFSLGSACDVAPLCKNCKHWSESIPDGAFGMCEMTVSEDGEPLIESTLAFARDSDQEWATLRTRPTFGCVQFGWHGKEASDVE